ncbi:MULTISPECIES: hypothetical protein [Rhizobium]|uniref:hypothetical protein n=1 Tax=Rhizobium TaxID=379 RepID=UPI0021B0C544|nr:MULTISPECIES: hypothetical protein [Rhizobium]
MSPGWLAIPRTAAVALTLAVAGSAQAAGAILTPAQMREDLTFLEEKWAPLDKIFSDSQRVAFGRHLDETASEEQVLRRKLEATEHGNIVQ